MKILVQIDDFSCFFDGADREGAKPWKPVKNLLADIEIKRKKNQ